jgi:hypothetical protein
MARQANTMKVLENGDLTKRRHLMDSLHHFDAGRKETGVLRSDASWFEGSSQ